MSVLPAASRRRLLKLPLDSGVWEGGWQPLPSRGRDSESGGSCILWADRNHAFVRAIDVLEGEPEPEAIARALLRAMESPQHPSRPARPQKIVVRDRQLQFYLRGVLQDLDIKVEYAAELPLTTEIFEGLKSFLQGSGDEPAYPEELDELAEKLWHQAPWRVFSDHHILALELNHWDLDTLYLSIMGQGEMEYGVLVYRTLESLRQFRQQAVTHQHLPPSMEAMQAAFLNQDCLFLNYESAESEAELLPLFAPAPVSNDDELMPEFGSIHPIEGMRAYLHEEETSVMYVTLMALSRFWQKHQKSLRAQLKAGKMPDLKSRFQIALPDSVGGENISVTLATQPQLAAELYGLDAEEPQATSRHVLQDDLVPDQAICSIGSIPWEMVQMARLQVAHHQPGETKAGGDGLPILMVQTSQPKAKTMIASIKAAGGVESMGFTTGVDPLGGDRYELGILQTVNHQLHLFGEFDPEDLRHQQARQKWQRRCQQTKGWCGVLITKGLTGASRGNPKLQDMLALFEVRNRSGEDLGLGELKLMPVE
jgi:hypothetical protein